MRSRTTRRAFSASSTPTAGVRPLATNIAFERTLGYDPSESGGDVFWELYVPADDADVVREAIEETVHEGTVTERDGTMADERRRGDPRRLVLYAAADDRERPRCI